MVGADMKANTLALLMLLAGVLQFPGQPEKTNPCALIEFIQAKLAKRK